MLRSTKQIYGHKLEASDGEIGHVKDFYFDDRNWAIRYVVADTGLWLPGRKVLLSPHALSGLDLTGKTLRVNLTRKQIENSPSIESHKPVSRQYEEQYYLYYGWPGYWQGNALWGNSGSPALGSVETPFPSGPVIDSEGADAHLRSTQAVNGYHLQASDGTVGHVCDFIMDARDWVIHQVVVKTGHRLSGHEVRIPVGEVDSISYEKSTMTVRLTGQAVEQSPEHHLV